MLSKEQHNNKMIIRALGYIEKLVFTVQILIATAARRNQWLIFPELPEF
jgi:hypothetical protein